MAEVNITINGNVVGDPELRFTPSGAAVANFSVASTPRKYDKNSGEWVDGTTTFLKVNAWRELAEGAADALVKGDPVVVIGKLTQRSYENNAGEKRTVFEVEADDIGKSVRLRKPRGESRSAPAAAADGPGW